VAAGSLGHPRARLARQRRPIRGCLTLGEIPRSSKKKGRGTSPTFSQPRDESKRTSSATAWHVFFKSSF
jgi:hypothetical protein